MSHDFSTAIQTIISRASEELTERLVAAARYNRVAISQPQWATDPANTDPDRYACVLAVNTAVVDPCPECRGGKHVNCDGQTMAFLPDGDMMVGCPCHIRGHTPGATDA